MGYPFTIPEWNKFRVTAPSTLDTDNPISFVISNCPPELFRFLVGQVSILADVTAWQSGGSVTPEALVDAVNSLEINMDICTVIADCIRTNSETQQAVRDVINGPGGTGPAEGVFDQTETSHIDCVWGGCLGLIDYLFDELTTVLDALDAATDTLDAASDYLPDSGYSGIAKGVLNVFELVENAGSFVIRSSMTTAARDRIACSLFCYILNNTGSDYRVTNDHLVAWADTLGTGQPDQSLNWLVFGIPVSPFLVPISILDETRLISYYVLGTEDCSNTWDTLCTCLTWRYTYDFLVSDYGASPKTSEETTPMVWESGRGWKSGDYANVLERARLVDFTLPAWLTNAVVTGWEVEIEIENGTAATGNAFNGGFAEAKTSNNTFVDGIGRTAWEALSGVETINHSIGATSVNQTGYRIIASTRNFNTSSLSGFVYVRRLTVFGTGNPPQMS